MWLLTKAINGYTVHAMDSNQPIYDYVMQALRAKRIEQRRIAAESGVAYSTLTKIAQGQTDHPSVHNIQRLYDYFRKLPPTEVFGENPVQEEAA